MPQSLQKFLIPLRLKSPNPRKGIETKCGGGVAYHHQKKSEKP
ncbi:hypothetical protein ARMA_2947 [Ardenticatena maritima]|uniref:Uncharacterized protein n=1 Tax=Ardenticatena maritima TaxID=872965 RepID=A0A0M9UDY6_9CHLR|nr:hypothetical protein ARMA_2947 [Ardenticatena maritima]